MAHFAERECEFYYEDTRELIRSFSQAFPHLITHTLAKKERGPPRARGDRRTGAQARGKVNRDLSVSRVCLTFAKVNRSSSIYHTTRERERDSCVLVFFCTSDI